MAQLGHEYRRKRQFKRRYIPERSVRLLLYGHIGFRLMRIFFFRERSFRYLFIWLSIYFGKQRERRRFLWFHLIANIPVTRKSSKARMGKGKGKLRSWRACMYAGRFLFEFRYYSKNYLFRFFKVLSGRFDNLLSFVYRNINIVSFPGLRDHGNNVFLNTKVLLKDKHYIRRYYVLDDLNLVVIRYSYTSRLIMLRHKLTNRFIDANKNILTKNNLW